MPELPEVETLRLQMEREIVGRSISDVVVRFAGRINKTKESFAAALRSKRIRAVERRAKILRIVLDGGQSLLVHLKMSGRFLLRAAGHEPTKHTHVVFVFSDRQELHFEDARKFGYLYLMADNDVEEIFANKYGPEPLGKEMNVEKFIERLQRKPNAKIKPLLLEQEIIAGVGNIYADEACFTAKIHPTRRVREISTAELGELYTGLREALEESLRRRGTSADKFLDLYGNKGDNVQFLKVYGREGEPCMRCNTPLTKIRLGGRGTHFCENCQKI
jgi:formamidopyrimidine-DNA glycosylase